MMQNEEQNVCDAFNRMYAILYIQSLHRKVKPEGYFFLNVHVYKSTIPCHKPSVVVTNLCQ